VRAAISMFVAGGCGRDVRGLHVSAFLGLHPVE
jgi:hypothetical protein